MKRSVANPRLAAGTIRPARLGVGAAALLSACTVTATLDDDPDCLGETCRSASEPPPRSTSRPGPEVIVQAGAGTAACRLVTQRSVHFGDVLIGTSAQAVLSLTNPAPFPCAVQSLRLSPHSQAGFVVAPNLEGSLVVEATRTAEVLVLFKPEGAGASTGTVLVDTQDEDQRIELWGRGVEANAGLTVAPASLDFGPFALRCRNGPLRTIELATTSERPVQVYLTVVGAGAHAFRPDRTGLLTIDPGSRLRVSVRFVPDRLGAHWGRLAVESDDGGTRYLPLHGVGAQDTHVARAYEGGATRYALPTTPMRDSINVLVDERPIPARYGQLTAWSVDYGAPAIVFEPWAVPRYGARVDVRYRHQCVTPTCGDGVRDEDEACDDGNAVNSDTCLSTCERAYCGDGYVHHGQETCDDRNTIVGDGCNHLCRTEVCGNTIVESPEQCDDGPLNSNTRPDSCRLDCRYPGCGDGIVDDGEECDDANVSNQDACVAGCLEARCGDGLVQEGVETCDDQNLVHLDSCGNDCQLAAFSVSDEPVFDWNPVVVGQTVVPTSSVPLDLTINYLGQQVRALDLSVPGVIGFGGGSAPRGPATGLPTSTTAQGFVAWWWDRALDGELTYEVSMHQDQNGPDPQVVLRFQRRHSNADTRLAAEVRIHATAGRVDVAYGPQEGDARSAATVGWQSAGALTSGDLLGCSPGCALSLWPSLTRLILRRQ